MRRAVTASLIWLTFAGPCALADGKSEPSKKSDPAASRRAAGQGQDRASSVPRPARTQQEREAAALAFVRENHKELVVLLEELKPMRPAEYERAIRDLYQVSRTLANLKGVDPERYETSLAVWKAKSRVDLLTARLVNVPSQELESDLRGAIETQVDAELRQQRLELKRAEERAGQLRKSIGRLESKRDDVVSSRYQKLLKKGQNMRQQEAGKSAPVKSAPSKGERKA